MQNPKLIRLPDGSFAHPGEIRLIQPLERLDGTSGVFPDRVIVHFKAGAVSCFNCESPDEATALAERIGNQVNDALGNVQETPVAS